MPVALNPELQRNLWLELTAQRLLLMPAVLGAISYIAWAVDGNSLHDAPSGLAWLLFVLLAVLWGARLAGDAVTGEVVARTWDGQRLTPMGAWAMTWGKLAGATVYAWYGALLCLALRIAGLLSAGHELAATMFHVVLLLLAALFAQAVVLLASLQQVRRTLAGSSRGIAYPLLGALVATPMLLAAASVIEPAGMRDTILWYSLAWHQAGFMLLSAVVFAALALLGCYRAMRAELQVRNGPWLWLVSALFLMAYFAGFVTGADGGNQRIEGLRGLLDVFIDPLTRRCMAALLVALVLLYVLAMVEPKNPVVARRMSVCASRGQWRAVLQIAPRWLLTLPLVVLAALSVMVLRPTLAPALLDPDAMLLSLLLFVLRDLALLLLLHLSRKPARADLAWLVYLGVLYVLAPALALVLGGSTLVAWFWPRPDVGLLAAVLPPALQAGVLVLLLWRRWRTGFGRVEGR